MSAEQQNDLVAQYILTNCPDEIGDEGAGDVAVRLLDKYRTALQTTHELSLQALTPCDKPPLRRDDLAGAISD